VQPASFPADSRKSGLGDSVQSGCYSGRSHRLAGTWHAALGMSLSSLIVVLNALRLYLLSQPEYQLTDDATE
jgi:hypothetical protein